jgi:hypothetical protein
LGFGVRLSSDGEVSRGGRGKILPRTCFLGEVVPEILPEISNRMEPFNGPLES